MRKGTLTSACRGRWVVKKNLKSDNHGRSDNGYRLITKKQTWLVWKSWDEDLHLTIGQIMEEPIGGSATWLWIAVEFLPGRERPLSIMLQRLMEIGLVKTSLNLSNHLSWLWEVLNMSEHTMIGSEPEKTMHEPYLSLEAWSLRSLFFKSLIFEVHKMRKCKTVKREGSFCCCCCHCQENVMILMVHNDPYCK